MPRENCGANTSKYFTFYLEMYIKTFFLANIITYFLDVIFLKPMLKVYIPWALELTVRRGD